MVDGHQSRQGRNFVSALQVARLAGVSRSAVSRAFTEGASIAPETRERVMQAAGALGYHVNDLARGLLARQSRLVGIVVTKPEEGIRTQLLAALTAQLIRRGSVPIVLNTGLTGEERASAQRILMGHMVEAVIVLSGSPPSSFVEAARRNGQPVIVLGRADPGTDHLMLDNDSAGRTAAALFHSRGFERLGLVSSWAGTLSLTERERAFQDEAQRRGLAVAVGRGELSDYEGGVAAAESLLVGVDPPQAVFCVNDLLAFGVMDHARQVRSLSVPGNLSVIGFDDVPQAAWGAYRLTTFRQDPMVAAEEVIRMIERRQANPDLPPQMHVVGAPLMLRETAVPGPGFRLDAGQQAGEAQITQPNDVTDPAQRSGREERLRLAEALIGEAGALAMRHFQDVATLEVFAKQNAQDVVSAADREVERLIWSRIHAAFPEDGMIGEEFGRRDGHSGWDWVVDPIDGTSCFVHGLRSWCVSIAVRHDGVTELGFIFDPDSDELFAAIRSGGAMLNGRPITVDGRSGLDAGLIGLGVNHRVPNAATAGVVLRLLDAGGIFVRSGSGALMLAHVACGRLIGYYEAHMNVWDCLAGLLIITEAGGWAADFPGHDQLLAGGPVIAAAPQVRADLLRVVAGG
jgi:DNA-binding LacI/PurR family transcriptional regulator/fructose-1,6-bisphosphatase/inositol monophosphatase family enzyme